jgi:hypothetical protein
MGDAAGPFQRLIPGSRSNNFRRLTDFGNFR